METVDSFHRRVIDWGVEQLASGTKKISLRQRSSVALAWLLAGLATDQPTTAGRPHVPALRPLNQRQRRKLDRRSNKHSAVKRRNKR
jgi:hypothetical protein